MTVYNTVSFTRQEVTLQASHVPGWTVHPDKVCVFSACIPASRVPGWTVRPDKVCVFSAHMPVTVASSMLHITVLCVTCLYWVLQDLLMTDQSVCVCVSGYIPR